MMDVLAEVTWFYHWGPREAGALTWTELMWWHAQAQRIVQLQQLQSSGEG